MYISEKRQFCKEQMELRDATVNDTTIRLILRHTGQGECENART